MDYLDEFVIPYYGLKPGIHHYEFDVDDKFFEAFEYSEIEKGRLKVTLELDKQERMFILQFFITGTVNVMCDRCSGMFDHILDGKEKLIVKLGFERNEESHDILVIPESEHSFDISPYIYEYIVLMLPAKKIHPDDKHGNSTCDPDVLRILEKYRYENRPDSRWDDLKKLKDNSKDNINKK